MFYPSAIAIKLYKVVFMLGYLFGYTEAYFGSIFWIFFHFLFWFEFLFYFALSCSIQNLFISIYMWMFSLSFLLDVAHIFVYFKIKNRRLI